MLKTIKCIATIIGLAIVMQTQAEEKLMFVGSTTVSPVIKEMAEDFRTQTGIQIFVRPLGSSKGIKAAASQSADFGMASRELKAKEVEENPEIVPVKVAIDGFAVIVNNKNPIDNITKDEIQKIYASSAQTWNEVAGNYDFSSLESNVLYPVSKGQGHGTLDAFISLLGFDKESQMEKGKLHLKLKGAAEFVADKSIEAVDQEKQILARVAYNENAIGFISFATLRELDERVKVIKYNGVEPSTDSVKNDSYTLHRPLQIIYHKQHISDNAKKFIEYLKSDEAKNIIESMALIVPHD